MKLKQSTPYPNKSSTSLSHNALSTLHNISSIVKPRNIHLDEENINNQISMDLTYEKTTAFPNEPKKKRKRNKYETGDEENSCRKEEIYNASPSEDDCSLTDEPIKSPCEKKDLSPDENGVIIKQKETKLKKHIIHDMEPCIVPELDNNEDPVDFNVPELHGSESVNALSKEQTDIFKSKGIQIRMGKWSKSEDEILRRNYNEFCGQFKINEPSLLLGMGNVTKVAHFLKAKHFYIRLGKDLNNRTLNSIYQRARRLYNPLKGDTKFSKKDVSSLKHALDIYGNKWNKIGGVLNKSATQARESYRWNQKLINKGKWMPEENETLISAIKSVVGTSEPSSQLIKTISWEKVAELVPTRNSNQCRLHWGEKLACDPDVTELLTWNRDTTEELFKMIKSKHYNDETEIDWESMYESFKNVAPSYMFLQKKWRKLKSSGKYFKTINNLFVN